MGFSRIDVDLVGGGGINFEIKVFEAFSHQCCDLWITPDFSELVFQLVKL